MSCFFFLSFVFSLLQNQRTGGQNRSCPEVGLGRVEGGEWQERSRRVNTVQKMYTHTYVNAIMKSVVKCSMSEGKGYEREQWRG
jgi:hypothetical protein